jgi:competence protein ComEA
MFCLVLVVSLFAKVDLNTASVDQLQGINGIGAKKAQAIVDYRKKHKFTKTTDLMNVPGIGPKLFAKIKGQVSLNLKKRFSKKRKTKHKLPKKVKTKATKYTSKLKSFKR